MKPAQCNGKNVYDKRTAQTVANDRNRRGVTLRIYQCADCNWWHLTSKPRWSKRMYQGM